MPLERPDAVDKELVEELYNVTQQAAYNLSDTVYVGSEFYRRLLEEPYFARRNMISPVDEFTARVGGFKIVRVGDNRAVAGG